MKQLWLVRWPVNLAGKGPLPQLLALPRNSSGLPLKSCRMSALLAHVVLTGASSCAAGVGEWWG